MNGGTARHRILRSHWNAQHWRGHLLKLLYSAQSLDFLLHSGRTVIQLWRYVVGQMGWRGRLTQVPPLWHGTQLHQVAALPGFRKWDMVGISTLGDIMKGTTLKSFQQLQVEFQLRKSQFYKYLQLRHALTPTILTLDSLPEFHPLEGRLLMGDLGGAHKIRQVYQTLTTHSKTTLYKTRQAWQDDIPDLTDDDWAEAIANPRGVAVSSRYRLIQFK